METTLQAFAENLRRLRLAKGWTQDQLAQKSGLSSQSVSNYEKGTRWPQADVLDVLAKTLQTSPWRLVFRKGDAVDVPPELTEAVAAAARLCGYDLRKRG